MNVLILLGTDGMKCLSCMIEEKDTICDRYSDLNTFSKMYKNCDIFISYKQDEDDKDRCVYGFHSSKRGASCDKLIAALGGSSLNQRAGIIAASKDLLKLDSNRYYILELNHSVGDMWNYLPLRDCDNLPDHSL